MKYDRTHPETVSTLPIGTLVDGKHRPTSKDIATVLGKSSRLWDALVGFISEDFGIKGQLEFGGAKYGWALEFRKGGKPLAALYPADQMFVVQIVLGRDASIEAGKLELGSSVRRVYDSARQLHDGRWLFVPVRTIVEMEDLKRLIRVKVETKKK